MRGQQRIAGKRHHNGVWHNCCGKSRLANASARMVQPVQRLKTADLARAPSDRGGRNLPGGWYFDIAGCDPDTVGLQIAVALRLYGYRGACCSLKEGEASLLEAAEAACRVLGAPLLLLPAGRSAPSLP